MSDDLRDLGQLLRTRAFGRSHEHHDRLASTNDRAAAWLREGAAHGAVVTAEAQTQGRGRRGRSWASPAAGNLYVSVVLRPDAVRPDFGAVGLAVGVGLAEGLAVAVDLKWPNDLLVEGRKLAGILCESRWVGGRPDVVVGFGLNVHQADFDGELTSNATSLARLGQARPRALLLADLLVALEGALERFVSAGFAAVRDSYEGRCSMLGHTVEVDTPKGRLGGTAEAIADDGALLMRVDGREALMRIEVADVAVAR